MILREAASPGANLKLEPDFDDQRVVGRRAGRHAGELIFQDRLDFVRRNRGRLALLLCFYPLAATLVGLWFHLFAPFVLQFYVGAASVGFVWLVAWFLEMDNSHFRRRGLWAEQWTTQTLKKKLGNGWRIFDDLPFARGNVDHVLIGPGGIYAVETKWRSKSNRTRPLSQESMRRDTTQAWRGAMSLVELLRESRVDLPVRPVLVLWGPGILNHEDGARQFGRLVVLIGDKPDEWPSRVLERDNASRSEMDAAARAIGDYLTKQPSSSLLDLLSRPIRIVAALLSGPLSSPDRRPTRS